METLNWGYIQLCLVALAFGGLQVWWIGRVLWKRKLARPLNEDEFRKALEKIWKKEKLTTQGHIIESISTNHYETHQQETA